MKFGKDLMTKVLNGEKTVTRRLGEDCLYYPMRTYTATDRGRWAKAGTPYRSCKIVILKVDNVELGSITDSDARLEGFKEIDDFKDYWIKHLRFPWMPTTKVWRIEFKVLK